MRSLSGTLFEPGLVEAFCEVAASEAFWLSMEPLYLNEELELLGKQMPPVMLQTAELLELADLFSRVVDAKSHYTDDHSRRVAAISRHLAAAMGRTGDSLIMIELAGLLHDMGKLRVPDEIIEKPGTLNRDERAYIARHSYDTYRILLRIFPDTPIPGWAGSHHENLLGQGYPFRTAAGEIDLETRIISVADIFQALLQDRPYRPRLDARAVVERVQAMVDEGRLDADVVAVLIAELDSCLALALPDGVRRTPAA
ncbi:3'3'-cGAMP-specific phosphodiesterase 1 [bioreactor metagenome]|uniref:3'3'-cGAMP-specific phosphodiesterase 1 n=1 Tax=bioreactor metagenome TaxID=1076179 RepID=A0A645D474_9ZZZZ